MIYIIGDNFIAICILQIVCFYVTQLPIFSSIIDEASKMDVRKVTDNEIIDLYWVRSESAIQETVRQYGSFCTTISMNILKNKEDAEECVNDTYLKAWDAIPPQRPTVFSSFLGRIVRNLSLDRYKARKAQKRSIDETALLLSELDDCIPSTSSVEDEVDTGILEEMIDRFLSSIGKDDRVFFVRRYWFADPITGIAERFAVGESKVKTSLFRTRNKLREYLEKEGVAI